MCPCPHSALCAETSACDLDERQTGIGRPPGKMEAASYVLRRFSKQESEELDFTFQTGIEAVRILLLQGFDKSATFIFISNEDLDAIRVQSTRGKKRNDSMNIVVAVAVGVVSVAFGIGVPIFYESQIDNASKRDNTQPCFPCNGTGAQSCRFCTGSGTVTVELGGGETEVSRCINCDGAGGLTCTTCQSMDSPR
ncbi:SPA protein, chloroplastic [Tanacetum coccineum]